MRTIVKLAGVATALVLSSLASNPAAAVNVVFTSAVNGNDGTCSGLPNSPCRTLFHSLQLASSGDVIQLETGGDYFGATVDKSITIYSPHGAAIFGFPCLTVNGSPTDVVTLDGIICIPTEPQVGVAAAAPFTSDGIVFNSGDKLRIRNSRIQGANNDKCGLLFQPSNNAELDIENSLISENGTTGAGGGVCIQPVNNASVVGVIDRLTAQNNRWAFRASYTGSSQINLLIQNSVFSRNNVGLRSAGGNSTLRVTKTSIYQNGTGIQPSAGGAIISFGDNVLVANTTNGVFSSTESRQ